MPVETAVVTGKDFDAGGIGVSMGSGVFYNSGTILGGAGDKLGGFYAYGGVGVYLHGGTLINAGTIVGGAHFVGGLGGAYNDPAVKGYGVIVQEPGAVLDGDTVLRNGKYAFTGIIETVESTQTEINAFANKNNGYGQYYHSTYLSGYVKVFFDGNAEFGSGEGIVLNGFSATSETYVSGVGLELSNGSDIVTLGLAGSFSTSDFSIAYTDGATTITNATGPQNGPLELTKPATVTIDVGQSTISGISLSETGDTTGEIFTVVLSDANGLLSATGAGITGSESTSLTITGSLALVNADLATLQDTDGTAAPDTITLSATDSLGGETSGSIAVTVNGSIGAYGFRLVSSGESVEFLTASNDGIVLIGSGGTASSDVLNHFGLQGVLSGGTADGTVINNGGAQGVLGTAMNTQIESGGVEVIGPGGISVDTTINSGGLEFVLPGGTAAYSSIGAGGTELLAAGAQAAGRIDFTGSDATLLIGGTALPTSEIGGFDLNGASGDEIVLRDFNYVAGHDSATLGAGNILQLDLNGTIERLYLDPSENYVGHSFSITTNSQDQVVVIDSSADTGLPKMNFLAAASGSAASISSNALMLASTNLSADIGYLTSLVGGPAAVLSAAVIGVLNDTGFTGSGRGSALASLFQTNTLQAGAASFLHSG